MSRLTPRQSRLATILGVVIYGVVIAGTIGWLVHYSPAMRRIVTSRIPRAEVHMAVAVPVSEAAPVPASWTDGHGAAPAHPETPPPAPTHADVAKPEKPALPAAAPAAVSGGIAKWQKYAHPFDGNDKRSRLVLVLATFGMANDLLKTALADLPGEVTFAVAGSAANLEQTIGAARTAGHEAVLALPMEPQNYPQNDPGANALLTGLPDADNIARLERGMAQTDGYVGIMPLMGGKFVTSEQKLSPVLQTIQQNGLLFLDDTFVRDSVVAPVARLAKLPFVRSDAIIDAAQNGMDMSVQLAALEKLAKDHGQAVAIILPYPAALEKLKLWIAGLDKKTFILAPLTAAVSP